MIHFFNKNRMQFLVPLLILGMMMFLAACGSEQEATGSGDQTVELTVSAAASLTDALQEIQENYKTLAPHVKLSFNFGASGALQQQIEQGAPVDIFISASSKNMDALVDKHWVAEGQQKSLLGNELTVITAVDQELPIQDASDLLNGKFLKVAVGIPETVPAGKYAQEALSNAGVWEELQPKLVQAKDVRQVLQYVQTGNAEAGIVYKTDALSSDKVKIAYTVDPSSYSPIIYPVGIVKATAHGKEAEQLYNNLQSKEAMDIFVKYGFSIPDAQ